MCFNCVSMNNSLSICPELLRLQHMVASYCWWAQVFFPLQARLCQTWQPHFDNMTPRGYTTDCMKEEQSVHLAAVCPEFVPACNFPWTTTFCISISVSVQSKQTRYKVLTCDLLRCIGVCLTIDRPRLADTVVSDAFRSLDRTNSLPNTPTLPDEASFKIFNHCGYLICHCGYIGQDRQSRKWLLCTANLNLRFQFQVTFSV